MEYNFKEIEKKWQNYWDENKTFKAGTDKSKPKFYGLVEFPILQGRGFMWVTPEATPPWT